MNPPSVSEDITDRIREYILDKHAHDKLIDSMRFIEENGYKIILKKTDGLKWEININTDIEANNLDMPRFEISVGNSPGDPLSMGISTESASFDFSKKGVARLMIASMCIELIRDTQIGKKTLLFIDFDESDGFWDKIKMRSNRYSEREMPKRVFDTNYNYGYGYEKVITFSNLCKFALGHSGGKTSSKSLPNDILAVGPRKKINTLKKRFLSKRKRFATLNATLKKR